MYKILKTHLAFALIASTHTVIADEIVVTAKGGQSVNSVLHTSHIFTQADIEASQVTDIPSLLDHIAGISVGDSGGRGSTTGVFLRGVSSSQTIVLIDGVRVGSATLGAAALNNYPVEAIERIEVVKGPFSGIYGADAVGGVIQLFTKKSGEGVGSATASVGSNSLTEYGLSFNGDNGRHSYHLSVNNEDTDGIDRTSILSDGNDDQDGFEETAINLGGQFTLTDNTIATLSVLSTDSVVEFDNTFGSDPGLQTESKTLSTAFSINSKFANGLSWNTTLGLNEDDMVTNGAFPSEFTTNRNSIGSEFAFNLSEETRLTTGADYYKEDIESSNNFPVNERNNSSLYVQILTGAGAFDVVSSIRYDDNSAYRSSSNGSIAVNYDVNDNLRAVVSYGTAFVAPSFNYLYFPNFGNPDIQPEESDNAELSFLGNGSKLTWRISAYQTDTTNLFSYNPDTFLAANIGEAQIKGLEVELSAELVKWQLGLSADFLSAEDKDTGLELNDRAEKTLAVTANRSFGSFDLRFDAKLESGRFDNSGTELPGYGLFDVSVKYQFNEHFSLFANIDNLFDKDYTVNLIGATERYNTEGRQTKLSLKYLF